MVVSLCGASAFRIYDRAPLRVAAKRILPTACCVLYTLFMSLLSDRAVVLRRLDYSETSQILAFLTRGHGLIRLIAKGIKRSTKSRFAPAIDLFELGDAVWSSRAERRQNLAILTEWKQLQGFVGLRENLDRLYAAQYAAEVTAALTVEFDPHPELFDTLVGFLEAVAGADQTLGPLCTYQRDLLLHIGLLPRGDACVGCHTSLATNSDVRVYFSSHEGGLLCRDCEPSYVEKRLVDAATLQASLAGTVTNPVAIEAFDLLNYHLSHLMHQEPKLAGFVNPAARRSRPDDPPTPG